MSVPDEPFDEAAWEAEDKYYRENWDEICAKAEPVELVAGPPNRWAGNHITGSAVGVRVDAGAVPTITNCHVTGGRGEWGISVQ